MAVSSQQWWNKVKASPTLLNAWLIKQYRGEATAASRISAFSTTAPEKHQKALALIAEQETQHAGWVLDLMKARGIEETMRLEDAEKRYWAKVSPAATDFHTTAAVAAHAEGMRLERIRVISEDETAPTDIRETFAAILVDELFHEAAFRLMAGEDAMESTLPSHRAGRELLGLVA